MEKILVILSSSNKDGNSSQLAKWFTEKANKEKYEFDFIHLYDLKIEHLTNENRKADIEQDEKNKDIRNLIDKIESAKKIIITTPIWNFGVTSALKKVIDRCLTSGRIWDNVKNKKVPGWNGKKFYLFFTMGSPWHLSIVNMLGVFQLALTLRYYGAKTKIVKIAYSCGNGSKNIVAERNNIEKSIHKRSKKIFR